MIDGVQLKTLKKIVDERGFLMEILRSDEKIFKKFGQCYLSTCNPGVIKGWHYHYKHTDNFVVVKGNARIVLYDVRTGSQTNGEINEFIIGEKNPVLLQIPPVVYHGVQCLGEEPSYLISIPSEPYNNNHPDEKKIPWDSDEIPYKWKRVFKFNKKEVKQ